jgi:hypothetical protein
MATLTVKNLTTASGQDLALRTGGTDRLTISSSDGSVTIGGGLALGPSPASSGYLRIPNNQSITARNAANTGNVNLIGLNSSDQVVFGTGLSLGDQSITNVYSISQTNSNNWNISNAGAATFAGTLNLTGAGAQLYVGNTNTSTQSCLIQIGNGRTGSGQSYIDFVGDTTYTDFGMRLSRDGGANGSSYIQHRGTGDLTLLGQDASAISLRTNNTERFRINSDGTACLNTSNTVSNAAQTIVIRSGETINTALLGRSYGGSCSVGLQAAGGTEASPSATTTSTNPLNIVAGTTSNGTTFINTASISIGVESTPTATSHPTFFAISTTPSASTTRVERFRINSSGNVGIGTASPLDVLDVTSGSTTFRARFRNTTANEAFASFQNTNTGTTTGDGLVIGINASAVAYLWNHENSDFIIGNNNVERMRITSSGDVGIGTASPGTKLDVSGSIRSSSQLISTVATGTAPLSVSSTTLVTNLNADLLDGLSATSANTGSTVVSRDSSGNFSAGTITANLTGTASGATTATYLNTAASSSTADNITTRVNSGFWETSTATTAEGWPETTNGWYHLLASTHSNAGNYYSMQFACNFNDSNALYYRATAGSGSTAWNKVWHAGNDGSGSGLNADLLDGLDQSPSNIGSTIVSRDSGGSFSAGTITATFSGNITGNVTTSSVNSTSTATVFSVGGSEIFRTQVSGADLQFLSNSIRDNTNAGAANVFISGSTGRLFRSSSSIRYKKDVEDIDDLHRDAILGLRPVWFRSKKSDPLENPAEWSYYGLIAEEVAEIEPRLVNWEYKQEDLIQNEDGSITTLEGAERIPGGVNYGTLSVLNLSLIQKLIKEVESLKKEIELLKS